MLRRVYDLPGGSQILVQYDDQGTGDFYVCTRPQPEWTWSPPWPCSRIDDDPPAKDIAS